MCKSMHRLYVWVCTRKDHKEQACQQTDIQLTYTIEYKLSVITIITPLSGSYHKFAMKILPTSNP